MGVSQAIPVALIINEAVTNSIKYAFPNQERGDIEITLHKVNGQIKLMICDNGIGIDKSLIKSSPASLGMKLIHGLSEDLNADIVIQNDGGTKIEIVFDVDRFDESDNHMIETNDKIFSYT